MAIFWLLFLIVTLYFHFKGGETIKEINRRSGAHVEIDKSSRDMPNGADKNFIIRGLPEQMVFKYNYQTINKIF